MKNRKEILARQLTCADCGASFTCDPAGQCWCAEEVARLPMPVDGADCLCPDCLRKLAATQLAPRA